VFSFSCPSINSLTETISANLEVAEDDAITLLFFLVKADMERKWKGFTCEDFRSWPVNGHTMIFTSEKNRPTNQIASSFQQMIFIC